MVKTDVSVTYWVILSERENFLNLTLLDRDTVIAPMPFKSKGQVYSLKNHQEKVKIQIPSEIN